MENLKDEQAVAKAEKRLEFADEVAKRLIMEYSAEEKRQFLKSVEEVVNKDYHFKLADAEKEVEAVRNNLREFTGNIDKNLKQ